MALTFKGSRNLINFTPSYTMYLLPTRSYSLNVCCFQFGNCLYALNNSRPHLRIQRCTRAYFALQGWSPNNCQAELYFLYNNVLNWEQYNRQPPIWVSF